MTDEAPLEIKGEYTVAELSRLMRISRKRLRLTLTYAHVPTHRIGLNLIVFVADLQKQMPVLWESIVACERMLAIARVVEEESRKK